MTPALLAMRSRAPTEAEPMGAVRSPQPDPRPSMAAGRPPHVLPAVLSTIAHDLRSPLAALMTTAELLVTDLDSLNGQQIRELVTTLRRGTLTLHGLLENLLCASAADAGRLAVHPEPLDLRAAVGEVQSVLAPLLQRKAQPLRLSARAGRLAVLADRRRLDQVLLNLLTNASKFSPPGRPIDISLRARGACVRLTVADRGPGLPPGPAAALFEPFTRAAASRRIDGTGLGLAIVRAIVAAHGGRCGAQNRQGGGACFWVELPTPARGEHGARGAPDAPAPRPLRAVPGDAARPRPPRARRPKATKDCAATRAGSD